MHFGMRISFLDKINQFPGLFYGFLAALLRAHPGAHWFVLIRCLFLYINVSLHTPLITQWNPVKRTSLFLSYLIIVLMSRDFSHNFVVKFTAGETFASEIYKYHEKYRPPEWTVR